MKPIRLVQYTVAQSGTGRATETVAASYNVWAELTKTGTGRTTEGNQTQLQNTVQFKMFIRSFDISGNWKLVWAGKDYTVQSITRIEEKKFNWQITATASGKS